MMTVLQVLMTRDGMSQAEAEDEIKSFRSELAGLLDAEGTSLDDLESLLEDWFGLEPDYLMEFMPL